MNKKDAILNASLQLFSKEEYAAVSSIKIAQLAKVSDALIFKHFKNKANLFQVLINKSESQISEQLDVVLQQNDIRTFIKNLIEIPFNFDEENILNWELYMKLKWQNNFSFPPIWTAVEEKLEIALTELAFSEPKKEAGLLILIVESIIGNIILNGKLSMLQYKYFLIHKYTL